MARINKLALCRKGGLIKMSIMRYTHTNTYTRSVCARLNYVYAAYAADQKSSVGATHAACVHLSSLGCHVEPVSVICPGASQINFVPDHSCLGKQAKEGRRGVCHMPHTYLMASVPHKVSVCLCVCVVHCVPLRVRS